MVTECVVNNKLQVSVLACNIKDQFVEQGSIEELRKEIGLDADSITEKVIDAYKELS